MFMIALNTRGWVGKPLKCLIADEWNMKWLHYIHEGILYRCRKDEIMQCNEMWVEVE